MVQRSQLEQKWGGSSHSSRPASDSLGIVYGNGFASKLSAVKTFNIGVGSLRGSHFSWLANITVSSKFCRGVLWLLANWYYMLFNSICHCSSFGLPSVIQHLSANSLHFHLGIIMSMIMQWHSKPIRITSTSLIPRPLPVFYVACTISACNIENW